MEKTIQPLREQVTRRNKKCFCCNKRAWFTDWTGWNYCFNHWVEDYKWGRCHGLWKALKQSRIIF